MPPPPMPPAGGCWAWCDANIENLAWFASAPTAGLQGHGLTFATHANAASLEMGISLSALLAPAAPLPPPPPYSSVFRMCFDE